ncbi:hypothetical protein KW783_01360 [Candidatus Parcubacteria bacterium]|nr:hypothetical protein [Candidatus Parcubacteria bacterium]
MAKETPIPKTTGYFMIAVALSIDGVQFLLTFIPIVGWIINMILSGMAWLIFYMWFKSRGISFGSPKRALSLNGGFLLELIPIFDALPGWTATVMILVFSTRVKEVTRPAPTNTRGQSRVESRSQTDDSS